MKYTNLLSAILLMVSQSIYPQNVTIIRIVDSNLFPAAKDFVLNSDNLTAAKIYNRTKLMDFELFRIRF